MLAKKSFMRFKQLFDEKELDSNLTNGCLPPRVWLPQNRNIRRSGPATVAFDDNVASHFSSDSIKFCKENYIYVTPYPGNVI